MCEPLADHGVNEKSGCAFYQTTRMSLTHLKFAVGSEEKESQLAYNRVLFTVTLKFQFQFEFQKVADRLRWRTLMGWTQPYDNERHSHSAGPKRNRRNQ